jgi:GTP diphosphokinase / guanosine-3',5'-bis(diphosphate) 3'-diphosphatase
MQDITLIIKAASFAAYKHRNQRRKDADASPYMNHPLSLARVLTEEGGCNDLVTICAALLHDTIEDTDTKSEELELAFNNEIRNVVEEVTDDKSMDKSDRKLAQIEHAALISDKAKKVKLADKICNLRDIIASPPTGWPLERKQAYFDWAKAVIDNLRGVDEKLEAVFDKVYELRP